MSDVATSPLLLRGIAVELEGNESDLVFARAVVSVDGVEHVARELLGELALVPLTDRDREYVRWLPDSEVGEIDLAEGVWVAGPRLVRALVGISPASLGHRILKWAPLGAGFRWTTGTYRDYRDFMQAYANDLEVALHRSIFRRARTRGKGTGAASVFSLYQAFALDDTLSRALNCALYYRDSHQLRALDLEIADAVATGHAKNAADFERQLDLLSARVLKDRLSEELEKATAERKPKLPKGIVVGPDASAKRPVGIKNLGIHEFVKPVDRGYTGGRNVGVTIKIDEGGVVEVVSPHSGVTRYTPDEVFAMSKSKSVHRQTPRRMGAK